MSAGIGFIEIIIVGVIGFGMLAFFGILIGVVVFALRRQGGGPIVVDHKQAPCPYCGSLTSINKSACASCGKSASASSPGA